MAAQDYFNLTQLIYIAYFGRPADPRGRDAFAAGLDEAKAPLAIADLPAAYAKSGAIQALVNGFALSTESATLYGAANTEAFVNAIFLNVLGREAKPAGMTYWKAEIDSGRVTKAEAALKIMAGAFANTTDPAQAALDQALINKKASIAATFTGEIDTLAELNAYKGATAAGTVRTMLQSVTGSTDAQAFKATVLATITKLVTPVDQNPGKSYSLTINPDKIVGTTGDDTVTSIYDAVAKMHTVTGLDAVDLGAGNDTINIADAQGRTIDLSLLTVTNVERLNVSSVTTLVNNSADLSGFSGLAEANFTVKGALQTIKAGNTTAVKYANSEGGVTIVGGKSIDVTAAVSSAPAAAVTAVSNSQLTSATVKNGSTVTITDGSSEHNKLTSVSLDGNSDAAVLTGNAIATVQVANTKQDVTVVNDNAEHAITFSLNKVSGGTITDAKALVLDLRASGAASSGVTVSAGAAEGITVKADADLALTALTAAAAKTLSIAGAGALTLGSTSTLSALLSVDATAATGAITINQTLANDLAYKGSAGSDNITVGATNKAITTGAGDDVVKITMGATALGAKGSIDAGDGIDTLVINAGNAETATKGTSVLGNAISGFERLSLTGVTIEQVNLANLDDLSHVTLDGGNVTLYNLQSGGTVAFGSDMTGAVININDGVMSASDVVNLAISGKAAVGLGIVNVAYVETIRIATDDTAASASGIAHSVPLIATSAKTITVAGDAGLNLNTLTGATALTTFDASGVTKGTVSLTTAALLNAAVIKGGAGGNNITFRDATKAVTYTGGAGVDSITASNSDNTISTAGGNDVVTLGSGRNTVDLGAGDDSIALGGNLNVVTGGAGKDTFDLSNTVVTNSNTYSTITDIAAGDIIRFKDGGDYIAKAVKVAPGAGTAFADYVNAAAAGTTAGKLAWFTFDGNTYVVNDVSASATFVNGADQIVKLSGVVDLSASTLSAAGVLTIV